jgi:hypothetical protein
MADDCYVYVGEVDGVVRYIGRGRRGRMDRHLREMRRPELSKRVLYRNLAAAVDGGAEVKFYKIAEGLTGDEAVAREVAEIASRPREQLWNMYPGWRRPKNTDAVRRQRNSAAQKRKWEDPEHQAKMRAALRSPERRAKISAAVKADMSRPERRDQLRQARRQDWADPNYRKIKRNTPEKASAQFAALWADPEYRAKMAAVRATPEYSAKQSAAKKAAWSDPEYRDKRAKSHSAAMRRPEVKAKIAAANTKRSGARKRKWPTGTASSRELP